jgi:pimeloyl-ACP methyl ester carboxylesterase
VSNAAYIGGVVGQVNRPVVLVGHSYGSMVITNAANGLTSVKALVFISAFIPAARAAIEETVSKPLAQGPAPREPAQAG